MKNPTAMTAAFLEATSKKQEKNGIPFLVNRNVERMTREEQRIAQYQKKKQEEKNKKGHHGH